MSFVCIKEDIAMSESVLGVLLPTMGKDGFDSRVMRI